MIVVKTFFTEWEAMRFIEQDPRKNLFVWKDLTGRYHVANGGE